ncbi:hypothetical protein N9Z49_03540 [Akkermansiaceae bacterium]|nr:hypothetical protein [Akkermansiaceae bacterium]
MHLDQRGNLAVRFFRSRVERRHGRLLPFERPDGVGDEPDDAAIFDPFANDLGFQRLLVRIVGGP